jgi:hypothetical protein
MRSSCWARLLECRSRRRERLRSDPRTLRRSDAASAFRAHRSGAHRRAGARARGGSAGGSEARPPTSSLRSTGIDARLPAHPRQHQLRLRLVSRAAKAPGPLRLLHDRDRAQGTLRRPGELDRGRALRAGCGGSRARARPGPRGEGRRGADDALRPRTAGPGRFPDGALRGPLRGSDRGGGALGGA